MSWYIPVAMPRRHRCRKLRKELHPTTYFSLEGFEFIDLFPEDRAIVEVVNYLPEYVIALFGSGRVRLLRRWRRFCLFLAGVRCHGRYISIGEGTRIYPGAFIGDGVVIGKNCTVGQNVTLRGPLILSDNCVVGPSGEVVGSIFLPGARAAHQNFVAHSIVGRDVNLGAGSRTANAKLDILKPDPSEISIKTEEGKIFTGLRKFGAIIGDGCSIGGNTVLHPGALLGKNCYVGSNVPVPNRYFPEGTVIYLPESVLVVKRTE